MHRHTDDRWQVRNHIQHLYVMLCLLYIYSIISVFAGQVNNILIVLHDFTVKNVEFCMYFGRIQATRAEFFKIHDYI